MKKILFSIVGAFMVSTMASAQYVNVRLEDGTWHSYKASADMEVSFGAKKGADVTESEINGHEYVELAGYKWATENVANFEKGLTTFAIDPTYGLYYTQSNDNAKKAAESWGGTWTLPTEEQWKALLNEKNCTWAWQDIYLYNDKITKGYKVSDNKDSSKFIFLPAAGISLYGNFDVSVQGILGYYWSSDYERHLYFGGGDRSMDNFDPIYGMAVRPVAE